MNFSKLARLSLLAILPLAVLAACGSDDDGASEVLPIGADVTLRNTLQDPGQPETAYPSLFEQPEDAFDEFGTVSNTDTEFPTALAQPETPMGEISGLYEIDLTGNSISFSLLPTADNPFWSNVFEVHPEGKFDRYYLTFSEPHNIESFSSDNSSVNLRIDSPTVAVVELGAEYDMNPGTEFTIDVE